MVADIVYMMSPCPAGIVWLRMSGYCEAAGIPKSPLVVMRSVGLTLFLLGPSSQLYSVRAYAFACIYGRELVFHAYLGRVLNAMSARPSKPSTMCISPVGAPADKFIGCILVRAMCCLPSHISSVAVFRTFCRPVVETHPCFNIVFGNV